MDFQATSLTMPDPATTLIAPSWGGLVKVP
jgi:hypothetical protein